MKFTSIAMAIAMAALTAAFSCGCCTCNEHDRDESCYTVKVHRKNGDCFPANFNYHRGKGMGLTREVLINAIGEDGKVENGVYPVRLWNNMTGELSADEIGYIYINRRIR